MKLQIAKLAHKILQPLGYGVRALDTTPFEEKLKHNISALTPPEKAKYYAEIRPNMSVEDIFWFEGDHRLYGELYVADRKWLYDSVIKNRPGLCIELGTYCGGGSTFFLAKALSRVGRGILVSSEIDVHRHEVAKKFYSTYLDDVSNHVEFILGSDLSLFLPYIEKNNGVDFLFLDGAEDAKQSVDQFHYFDHHMPKGAHVFMHDWNTDKMALLKGVIANDQKWTQVIELNPPESVGFAGFKKEATK